MKSSEDNKNHKTNLMYFNQMVEEKGVKRTPRKKDKAQSKKQKSFGSQKVVFSDYLLVLEGYESVFYPIYFLLIPYITGAIILFFLVAGASIDNFKLMEFDNFFVVWLIGYEVVATMMLVGILVAFLKYDDDDPVNKRHF